jgi:hypothetical protein
LLRFHSQRAPVGATLTTGGYDVCFPPSPIGIAEFALLMQAIKFGDSTPRVHVLTRQASSSPSGLSSSGLGTDLSLEAFEEGFYTIFQSNYLPI